jgi:hypothetical protein
MGPGECYSMQNNSMQNNSLLLPYYDIQDLEL